MTMTMMVCAPRIDSEGGYLGESPTQVNLRALPDLLLRSEVRHRSLVAQSWLEAWQTDSEGLLQWIEVRLLPLSDRTVVNFVEDLKARLGLPLRTVLQGAGIKRRTFYSWVNNPSIDPRVASAGNLWDLAACVEDLEGIVSDLKTWFADDDRREMLSSGWFKQLLDLAISSTYQGGRLEPSVYTADDSIEPEWSAAITSPDFTVLRRGTRVR